ncbi:collagen alpha-1(VII) chain-like [Pygocentrus nattereri]|uniref:collagen alpha-1(VII) chain-like n=1 Tax=Pygocentrus nattereri TaxID=42514 RepID=UPI001890BA26|nr:collagen alpha-1(VII) chain-like [Pygocentrus nattereri]
MRVRVGVEMLAVLVVVLLAPGLTGGLVLNKCTLQQQLNLTLNVNVLDRISEVATIVCHAELTSGLNTSAVNQIPAPHHDESQEQHSRGNKTNQSRPGPPLPPSVSKSSPSAGGAGGRPGDGSHPGPGGRKPRHAHGHLKPSLAPPMSNSSAGANSSGNGGSPGSGGRPGEGGRPGTGGRPDDGGHPGAGGHPDDGGRPGAGGRPSDGGRKPRHAQGHYKPSLAPPVSNSSSGARPGNHIDQPRPSGAPSVSNSTPRVGGRPGEGGRPGAGGRPDDDGHPGAGGHPGDGGRPGAGGRPSDGGRKPRHAQGHYKPSLAPPVSNSSSGARPGNHIDQPRPSGAPSVSNGHPDDGHRPGTGGHPSDGGRPGAGGRKPRSLKGRERPDKPRGETSHEEHEQHSDGVWTLYGLFQLADRVACVSGSKPSLNLCGLSCDRLIDDDITDDIACVGTIINNVMANGNVTTEANKLIRKMYGLIHQSECANVQSPSGC